MVKKRVISAMLAFAMVATMFAGCGKKGAKSASQASDDGKVLNIHCWNNEFQTRMETHYPGYTKVDGTTGKIGDVTVKWVCTPSNDNAYQNALDKSLLEQDKAEKDKKIDIFLIEADYALKYVDTDYTLDVEKDLGISKDLLNDQYQYTKDIVTDKNGNLKGVSWQASPGTMIYRRDVAKQVFGTEEPAEVQKAFENWDTMMASAKKLKDAGYQLTSSATDTYRLFSNNVTSPWVKDGKVNIDENIMNWVDVSKKMVDEGYAKTYDLFTDDWSKGLTSSGNTFCCFGPAWLIDFTLSKYDLKGKWAITPGPQSFYWGGTWICAANGTDNKSLVKDIIEKMTTDKATMQQMVEKDNEFVNNKTVIKEMNEKNTYKSEVLGGQNPLGVFLEGADKIKLNNITSYDAGCNEEFQRAMTNYFKGSATKEQALDLFYKNIETKYPDVKR